jgi:hypothetical protein
VKGPNNPKEKDRNPTLTTSTSTTPPPKLEPVKPKGEVGIGEVGIGEVGIIDGGSQFTFAAVTQDAYDEIYRASSANDEEVMMAYQMTNTAFRLARGTRVQVIDTSWLKTAQIKVLSGPEEGRRLWTKRNYIRRMATK